SMQPLALHLVNSIFLGDYLTSEGLAGQADLDMIADAGFEVEGAGTTTLPQHRADAVAAAGCGSGASACGSHEESGCGSHEGGGCGPCGGHAAPEQAPADQARTDLVAVRRRGAGTDLAPNA
ncbi:biotin synthase BioB, partial [Streptomyces violascens]